MFHNNYDLFLNPHLKYSLRKKRKKGGGSFFILLLSKMSVVIAQLPRLLNLDKSKIMRLHQIIK